MYIYIHIYIYRVNPNNLQYFIQTQPTRSSLAESCATQTMYAPSKIEVDALGVITISRGCFERCGSNKKTPP